MSIYRYVAFGVVIIASCLISFFILSPSQSVVFYKHIAYPLTILAYGIVVLAIVKCSWSKNFQFRTLFASRMIPVLLVFGVVTTVYFASSEWGFRTVMDEPLIVSTSQGLHYNRVPLMGWRGYNIEGNFTITDSYLDKRPIPFAVLVSVVHDLTGYRPENAFLLNNIIGVVSIILIGVLGYRIYGRMGSCLGMVLLGGLPVFIHYSNGAGFDVFNILMVMVVVFLGLEWYRDSSAWSMIAFVFAGVVLCQSRYESALYVIPIGLSVAYKWWRDRKIQLPWLLIVAPVIMMLVPLQQAIFKINQAFWELDSIPEADQIFGLKYFYPNLGHAMNFLWDWTDIYPNSPYLSCLGLLAFAILIAKVAPSIVERLKRNPGLFIWIVFAGGLVSSFLLMMVFFYGKLDLFVMHRFSLPIYLLAILLSIACLRVVPYRWMKQGILMFAFIGWFAYSIPVSAKQTYHNVYVPQMQYNWINEFANQNKDKKYLVIGENPIAWVLHNMSSTGYRAANSHPSKIKYLLDHQSFDDILVTVMVGSDPKEGTNMYLSKEILSSGFEKEFILRKRLHPFFFLNLYRLVNVDVEKVIAENQERESEEGDEKEEDDPFLGKDIETEVFEFSEDQKAKQEYYLNLP